MYTTIKYQSLHYLFLALSYPKPSKQVLIPIIGEELSPTHKAERVFLFLVILHRAAGDQDIVTHAGTWPRCAHGRRWPSIWPILPSTKRWLKKEEGTTLTQELGKFWDAAFARKSSYLQKVKPFIVCVCVRVSEQSS